MGEYAVKDINLASEGQRKIEWAESHMPVLVRIRERFQKERPLTNTKVSACLHVTKETAVLVRTLSAGGAEVALCASNPLSTQDDVAAQLAKEGAKVYAWRGQNKDEYYDCVNKVLDYTPNITLDDGADLITTIHTKRTTLLNGVIGGCEETTTGVIRLRAMAKQQILKYPVIAINDAQTKWFFDNRYGTGQSTVDGILRSTTVLLAGTKAVVAGYGWCGRGIATRLRGMGCRVIVSEVSPLKALEAVMDGFDVMPMADAAKQAKIFITASGDKKVITRKHIESMQDGAVLANAGHFNVEIWIPDLEGVSIRKRQMRENVEEYMLKDGRRIYLLAEGRLVNLAAAEGHPSEVMDMSFSNQALSAEYLSQHGKTLKPDVYLVPADIDNLVAELKLESMGIKIDKLTDEQRMYLTGWGEGT
nr:adenosylhomocysteinase [Candidatus Njordarchaeota archaeon]